MLKAQEPDNARIHVGLKTQTALVGADGAVELAAVAGVGMIFAGVVHPHHAEGEHSLRLHHDSHNIIVVGASEREMALAANRVVELGGGIVVCDGDQILAEVKLGIAGIMSDDPLVDVNSALESAKDKAFALGVSRDIDPFMCGV